MAKQVYRVIDSRGRVYLPKEVRLALGMENGSIVKLMENQGCLQLHKVHLVEFGDHSPEAVEAYVSAAVTAMSKEKRLTCTAIAITGINWSATWKTRNGASGLLRRTFGSVIRPSLICRAIPVLSAECTMRRPEWVWGGANRANAPPDRPDAILN